MVKKLNILLLSLFLFIQIVDAKIVDKPLNISIANCYSVNITAEQTDGVLEDISFKDCSKVDATHFFCNCLNQANNNFSIIMQSDNNIVRNIRMYDIYLNVKYFETYKKTMDLSVDDGGDYYQVWNHSWIDRDNKIIIREKPVYINQTVYVDKELFVPYNVTVFKDRNVTVIEYVNVTQYVENTTKIEQMKQGQKEEGYFLGILIGIIIILIFIIYFKNNKIKELKTI